MALYSTAPRDRNAGYGYHASHDDPAAGLVHPARCRPALPSAVRAIPAGRADEVRHRSSTNAGQLRAGAGTVEADLILELFFKAVLLAIQALYVAQLLRRMPAPQTWRVLPDGATLAFAFVMLPVSLLVVALAQLAQEWLAAVAMAADPPAFGITFALEADPFPAWLPLGLLLPVLAFTMLRLPGLPARRTLHLGLPGIRLLTLLVLVTAIGSALFVVLIASSGDWVILMLVFAWVTVLPMGLTLVAAGIADQAERRAAATT